MGLWTRPPINIDDKFHRPKIEYNKKSLYKHSAAFQLQTFAGFNNRKYSTCVFLFLIWLFDSNREGGSSSVSKATSQLTNVKNHGIKRGKKGEKKWINPLKKK